MLAEEDNLIISHHSLDHKTRDINVNVYVGPKPFKNYTDLQQSLKISVKTKLLVVSS